MFKWNRTSTFHLPSQKNLMKNTCAKGKTIFRGGSTFTYCICLLRQCILQYKDISIMEINVNEKKMLKHVFIPNFKKRQ